MSQPESHTEYETYYLVYVRDDGGEWTEMPGFSNDTEELAVAAAARLEGLIGGIKVVRTDIVTTVTEELVKEWP